MSDEFNFDDIDPDAPLEDSTEEKSQPKATRSASTEAIAETFGADIAARIDPDDEDGLKVEIPPILDGFPEFFDALCSITSKDSADPLVVALARVVNEATEYTVTKFYNYYSADRRSREGKLMNVLFEELYGFLCESDRFDTANMEDDTVISAVTMLRIFSHQAADLAKLSSEIAEIDHIRAAQECNVEPLAYGSADSETESSTDTSSSLVTRSLFVRLGLDALTERWAAAMEPS